MTESETKILEQAGVEINAVLGVLRDQVEQGRQAGLNFVLAETLDGALRRIDGLVGAAFEARKKAA